MIKLNKYQTANVIKQFRPELTEQKIKVHIRDLVLKNEDSPEFNEWFFWQASVNAVLNYEPLPWE